MSLRRTAIVILAILGILSLSTATAWSHCQIPCGIYDDHMRIHMLEEHITTIEKGMNQVTELSAAGDKNYNQIVRWVTNKDDHANKFMTIVKDYFMAQRIKPVDRSEQEAYAEYTQMIELCHRMLVEAMKCKQTTDLAHVANLKELVADFEQQYFEDEQG